MNRGNIQSAYGRIARREARYERALDYFENAMEEYARRNPRHPNIARSLVNMASAERLMRLQLRKKMDAAAASRKGAGGWPAIAAEMAEARKHFEQLREKALERLAAAVRRSTSGRTTIAAWARSIFCAAFFAWIAANWIAPERKPRKHSVWGNPRTITS